MPSPTGRAASPMRSRSKTSASASCSTGRKAAACSRRPTTKTTRWAKPGSRCRAARRASWARAWSSSRTVRLYPTPRSVPASSYYDNYYALSNAETNIFDASFLKIREARVEYNLPPPCWAAWACARPAWRSSAATCSTSPSSPASTPKAATSTTVP